MLHKLQVVFIANLAVGVVRVRHRLQQAEIVTGLAISVVVSVSQVRFLIFLQSLVFYLFEAALHRLDFQLVNHWAEAIWRLGNVQLVQIKLWLY